MGQRLRYAAGLVAVVSGVALAQGVLAWGFNHWQREFIDSLSNREPQAFHACLQLLGVILLLQMSLRWLDETYQPRLANRLRALRFGELAIQYFNGPVFLREARAAGAGGHDPAQRLVDDLRDWAELLVQLGSGALGTAIRLVLFAATLVQVMPRLQVFGVPVPFPMLLLAIISFGLSAGAIHLLGRGLPVRETERSNREARLRGHLAHLQPRSAAIAMLRGTALEQASIERQTSRVFDAVRSLAAVRARVGASSVLLGPSDMLAIIVLSPLLFRGELTFGQVFQIGMAHAAVGGALNWFVSSYDRWARLRAVQHRLRDWQGVLSQSPVAADALKLTDGDVLEVHDLAINAPPECGASPQVICRIGKLVVQRGERVVLRAPSGFGKSILLLLLSGNWPWARGKVKLPADTVFMPQTAYFPRGTLLEALCYPQCPTPLLRLEVEQALAALDLTGWSALLDESTDWSSRLSGGEQALAGLIRAWLQAREWVFLDEPNAALDPVTAERFWHWIRAWQNRTLVIVSHLDVPDGLGFRQADLTGTVHEQGSALAMATGPEARAMPI